MSTFKTTTTTTSTIATTQSTSATTTTTNASKSALSSSSSSSSTSEQSESSSDSETSSDEGPSVELQPKEVPNEHDKAQFSVTSSDSAGLRMKIAFSRNQPSGSETGSQKINNNNDEKKRLATKKLVSQVDDKSGSESESSYCTNVSKYFPIY